MVKIAREHGEGYTQYWWTKDINKDETFEKLSFSKDFPDWQMVISTGTYIDDIKKEVDKRKTELIEQLRQIMKETTIGKSGYLFIVDSESRMIMHPNKYMQGKYTAKMKNPATGNFIFDDTKKAGHTGQPMYAKWDKPTDKKTIFTIKSSGWSMFPDFIGILLRRYIPAIFRRHRKN